MTPLLLSLPKPTKPPLILSPPPPIPQSNKSPPQASTASNAAQHWAFTDAVPFVSPDGLPTQLAFQNAGDAGSTAPSLMASTDVDSELDILYPPTPTCQEEWEDDLILAISPNFNQGLKTRTIVHNRHSVLRNAVRKFLRELIILEEGPNFPDW